MSVSSADPSDLHEYVAASRDVGRVVDADLRGARGLESAVVGACSYGHPAPRALAVVEGLLDGVGANERMVEGVREALLAADAYGGTGVATVADREIEARIGAGTGTSGLLSVEPLAFIGLTPTSGFVDDPVNAFNGNFVHGEEDLPMPGLAAPLALVRIYNSLAHDVGGHFGPGWSSLLDMGLDGADVTAGTITARMADGARLPFARTSEDDSSWRCHLRPGWVLTVGEDGCRLADAPVSWWRFDAAGRVTGRHAADHRLEVARSADRVTVTEQFSGRSVVCSLADGRVVLVASSDGRRCQYRYDDAGRLVGVDRAIGDVAYGLDAQGRVSRVVDADGVVLVDNVYDTDGRVSAQVSRHGRRTDYRYTDELVTVVADHDDDRAAVRNVVVHDRRANVVALVDGEGAAARMAYDDANQRVRLTDREGNTTRYAYRDGRLVDRIDADGLRERWAYDSLGRLTTHVDRAGSSTELSYEGSQHLPATVTTPAGTTTIVRDRRGRPVRLVDPDGVVSEWAWDDDGLLTFHQDGLGARLTAAYDAAGRLTRVTEPGGRTTRIRRDRAGRTVAVRGADGEDVYRYSAAGRVDRVRLAGQGVTRAAHDEAGDLAEIIDPAGARVRFVRDHNGNVVETITPDGARHRHRYDRVGRLIQAQGPDGAVSRIVHDREGRSVQVTGPDGRRWSRTVDALGRTLEVRGPDGATTRRAYHPGGQVAWTEDPTGRRHTFDVDACGRVVAVTDPAGATTRYDWSPGGRLRRTTTSEGRTLAREYDVAGQLAAVVGPDGSRHAVNATPARLPADPAGPGEIPATSALPELDDRGLLAAVTDPAGVRTTFGRDARGHIVSATTDGASFGVQLDLAGRISRLTDPLGGVTDVDHDVAGRLIGVRSATGGWRARHDQAGGVTEVESWAGVALRAVRSDDAGRLVGGSADGHALRFDHDAAGRLAGRHDPAGATRYRYDQDGLLLERTDPDGTTTTLHRDPSGAVTGYGAPGIGVVAAPERDAGLTRGPDGRITVDRWGQVVGYDDAGRLAELVAPDGRITRYRYDRRGLLAQESCGSRVTTYVHNDYGQLVHLRRSDAPDLDYAYDAAGRRVRRESADGSVTTYRWDDLGQLVELARTDRDGVRESVRIRYDVLGRPVDVDGVAIGYDDVLSGKPVRVGETAYLRHGACVRPIDGSAAWDDGRTADPWGEDGVSGVRLGYRGELALDDLVLMGARVYDPQARQFLSPDPLPPVPGSLCFAGPYSYAHQDPVNHLDPSGRRPLSDAEFEALRHHTERNTFQHAWDTMGADVWSTVALVGVVALGVGLMFVPGGQVVGAGILIGAGTTAAAGLATDTFHPASVAIGGVAGGLAGPAGALSSVPRAMMFGGGLGAGEDVANQLIVQGRGLSEVDLGSALFSGTVGVGMAGLERYAFSGVLGRPDGQTVISGHGMLPDGLLTQVPRGTRLVAYGPHDTFISDPLGNAVETGFNQRRIPYREVFDAGSTIPDYVVSPPGALHIRGNAVTVDTPTRLSDLLSDGMGTCHLAFCPATPHSIVTMHLDP